VLRLVYLLCTGHSAAVTPRLPLTFILLPAGCPIMSHYKIYTVAFLMTLKPFVGILPHIFVS
jgi:hypothetical protein